MTAAGWYADPHDPTGVRYWDGVRWTDHTAAAVAPPPWAGAPSSTGVPVGSRWGAEPTATPTRMPMPVLLAGVGVGLAFLASFLPWGRVAFITVNGTDGDGKITAITSAVAAVLLLIAHRTRRNTTPLLGVAAALALATGGVFIWDGARLADFASDIPTGIFDIDVSVQFGLYLGVASSVLAVVSLVLCIGPLGRGS